jgi:hypothetical protein
MKPGRRDGSLANERLEESRGEAGALGQARRGAAVVLVGADEVERVDESAFLARRRDGRGQDCGRQLLAAGNQRVARARGQVAQHADGPAQIAIFLGRSVDDGHHGTEGAALAEGGASGRAVAIPELCRRMGRRFGSSRDGVFGALEQKIGDAAERGGHHHQGALVRGNARGGPRDGMPVGEGGSPELPHFKRLRTGRCHTESPVGKETTTTRRESRRARSSQGRAKDIFVRTSCSS